MERSELWDITNLIKCIEQFPQTYKSMLGDNYYEGTCQVLLRRKLNVLIKEGTVFKAVIPGTRFGKSIIYSPNKKYFILVKSERSGVSVFCFFNYKKVGKFWLIVEDAWELINDKWVNKGRISFFEGGVLLFI